MENQKYPYQENRNLHVIFFIFSISNTVQNSMLMSSIDFSFATLKFFFINCQSTVSCLPLLGSFLTFLISIHTFGFHYVIFGQFFLFSFIYLSSPFSPGTLHYLPSLLSAFISHISVSPSSSPLPALNGPLSSFIAHGCTHLLPVYICIKIIC